MDSFITEENLSGTFAYLDNLTVCGMTQAEHDVNLNQSIEAAKRKNIVYNEDKCVFSTTRLSILGIIIEDGQMRLDPEPYLASILMSYIIWGRKTYPLTPSGCRAVHLHARTNVHDLTFMSHYAI